jgi:hypothetical protein
MDLPPFHATVTAKSDDPGLPSTEFHLETAYGKLIIRESNSIPQVIRVVQSLEVGSRYEFPTTIRMLQTNSSALQQ